MTIRVTEENRAMAKTIESQFPFDNDRKELLLRDICVPLSMTEFFYEALSFLMLEDLSVLYLKYGEELQLKVIAEILWKTKEQTRNMYTDISKRLSKIYQGIMWWKMNEAGFFRQTNIYIALNTIYDRRKHKFSPEAELIMSKLSNTGTQFFYFGDERLSYEERLKIQRDMKDRARRLPACWFDEWHMPHFVVDTDRSNFLLKNFPGIVVAEYRYAEIPGKNEARFEHYFVFK